MGGNQAEAHRVGVDDLACEDLGRRAVDVALYIRYLCINLTCNRFMHAG
jgi:hypothetical protein